MKSVILFLLGAASASLAQETTVLPKFKTLQIFRLADCVVTDGCARWDKRTVIQNDKNIQHVIASFFRGATIYSLEVVRTWTPTMQSQNTVAGPVVTTIYLRVKKPNESQADTCILKNDSYVSYGVLASGQRRFNSDPAFGPTGGDEYESFWQGFANKTLAEFFDYTGLLEKR